MNNSLTKTTMSAVESTLTVGDAEASVLTGTTGFKGGDYESGSRAIVRLDLMMISTILRSQVSGQRRHQVIDGPSYLDVIVSGDDDIRAIIQTFSSAAHQLAQQAGIEIEPFMNVPAQPKTVTLIEHEYQDGGLLRLHAEVNVSD